MRYNPQGTGASSESLTNYKVIRIGDVAFEGHTNREFQYGRFVVNDLGDGIMSPRFSVLRPVGPFNISYWKQYLHCERYINRILVRSTKAGTMMNELVYNDLSKEFVYCPSNNEQQKIGKLLSKVDFAITLHEEKKRQFERIKSALLKKVFTDKSGYPSIRFEGFDKAWKQSKLGEITKVIPSKPYISTPSTHGNYLVIQQGDKPIAGFSDSKPFNSYNNITLFGDHTLSLFKPRSPFLVASDGIKILSPSIEMNGLFYFYALEKYKPQSEGYKRHFTILKKSEANFPTDIDEQKQISSLLLRIDNLIDKQQLRIDKLNETKKSLLQNMFI